MSHTPHELSDDFPHLADRIHALKVSDPHFARLAEKYHALNRTIHRAETNIEPMEQLAETALRKQRAALKDEIAALLRHA
jgi:uncharacterized protein YdcH (DUF465 family)